MTDPKLQICAFGTGTDVLDLDREISIGRFAVDGTTVTAPFRVVADPEGLAEPRLARRGTETAGMGRRRQ